MTEKSAELKNEYNQRRFSLAARRREEGDFIGALNVLNGLLTDGFDPVYVYREMGKVYLEMDLVRLALWNFLKYLNVCSRKDRAEAFNAIGACYFYLDSLELAGYYFDRQLELAPDKEFDYMDAMFDFFETIEENSHPEFYICYPPEKIPSDIVIQTLNSATTEEEYIECIKLLKKVKKSDENYVGAKLRVAAYEISIGNRDNAEKIVNRLIAGFPNDSLPIINKLVLAAESKNEEEFYKAYKLLDKFQLETAEEAAKVAAACMEFGYDIGAERYAVEAIEKDPYSISKLFICGAVKFNLHKFDESEKYFSRLYQITYHPVINYFVRLAQSTKSSDNPPRLSYDIRLPENALHFWVEKVNGYYTGVTKIDESNVDDVIKMCKWVYSFPNSMQEKLLVTLINKKNPKINQYFIDILLNPDLPDETKFKIVTELVYTGCEEKIGIHLNGFYSKIKLIPFEEVTEESDKNIVKRAYSHAFGKMCGFIKGDLKLLKKAALNAVTSLEENGNLVKIKDENALSAALVILSNGFFTNDITLISGYFITEKRKVNSIIKLIRQKNVDS